MLKTSTHRQINIKVLEQNTDMQTAFRVIVNGTKYPRARSDWYITNDEDTAILWALAERAGKYLSRGGVIYDSREDYLKVIEAA
jgi:hypothetical protein